MKPMFNGPDYVPADDDVRLGAQIQRIFDLMKDGKARSLKEIEDTTGDPAASISAQLRHLRKERFGGHKVLKWNAGGGVFKYRLVVKG